MASTSLSIAVAQAISFLTRPLIPAYPASTIIKLQSVLEANLVAHYAPTWSNKEPLRGSGRRCLTLSPDCLPPRVIYAACLASGVQWFDWMARLGGIEFDFFVDPGCVSIRAGKKGSSNSKMTTVWADELPSPAPVRGNYEASAQASLARHADVRAKSLTQQLLEHDQEDDERLFSMIADEVRAPTWMTPILDQFPTPRRSSSPLSTSSNDSLPSRSSSRSSNSSGTFSVSSSGSASTVSSKEFKQSRRERARQARVYVDTSKTEVTPYDGGRTTVLTGGVMLGGGPKKAARPTSQILASTWRATRA